MEMSKDVLDSSKCYVLDCGNEIYTWAGRNTSLDARKAAISIVEASIAYPSFLLTTMSSFVNVDIKPPNYDVLFIFVGRALTSFLRIIC